MTSWIEIPAASPFPANNLPYGIVSKDGGRRHVAVAIGDQVLSLAATANTGLLDDALRDEFGVVDRAIFDAPSLNPFLAKGFDVWHAVRARLLELVADGSYEPALRSALVARSDVAVHLPVEVADYVDFYCFEEHAGNVGRLFRPNQPPLLPNWHRLPVGYHGRAGTIVVSGTDIVRPSGQRLIDGEPEYGPSLRLDIEAEVGFVVGTPSPQGSSVSTVDFERTVFGAVLVNDWSARDIQAFEYVPLGPFLGKSFATSISPWVVPLEALAAARVPAPAQDPVPADYLLPAGNAYDLSLAVDWNGSTVSRPPFAGMYWTAAQQLAHLTVNGASLRTGDLYASGTVSGPRPGGSGCFLELTWGGAEPVTLDDGSERVFLADGDTITITGTAPGADGTTIGFGEVTGTILPARG
ncbi:fumarylacetoacetase [Actinocatenispora sera]|uniref:fumarylacetoacetase n=1 Tax=Actinocatenispora sera TaxID=390989 RepID=UPI0033C3B715